MPQASSPLQVCLLPRCLCIQSPWFRHSSGEANWLFLPTVFAPRPQAQPCTPSRSCMMPHAGSYHTLFLSLCTGVGAGGWRAAVLAQGHNRRWWEGGHSGRPLCTDGLWQHGVVALRPITSPPPGSRTRLLVSNFLSLLSRSTLGQHEVGQSAPGMGQWFWEHRAGPERGVLCRAVLLPLLLTASMGAISLARSTHRNASYCLQ